MNHAADIACSLIFVSYATPMFLVIVAGMAVVFVLIAVSKTFIKEKIEWNLFCRTNLV